LTAALYEKAKQAYPHKLILDTSSMVSEFLQQAAAYGMVLGEYDLKEILTQIIQDMHSDKPHKAYFVDLPERHRMIISRTITEEQQGQLQELVHRLARQIRQQVLNLRALDSDGVTFSYFLTELKGRDIYLEYLPW
jgi:hypothetical protein